MSKKSIKERDKAIRLAWERERELVLQGKGTRDWSLDQQKDILYSIRGTVPDAAFYPSGCRFQERCDECSETACPQNVMPELKEVEPGHFVRCFCV